MPFQLGTIAVGSDHRARDIVNNIAVHLKSQGWEVHTHYGGDEESVDYPCIAEEVANEIVSGIAACGVLICGSGIGMSMAANKVDGIRAALVHEPTAAEMSRRHNDANVLCMAANGPFESDYNAIIDSWLATDFEGGRHQRRVDLMR
ncbi:MAG: RpiB/LacA/LacB family sugar-phosphate isomerase [Planctomycetes bacterium]|nr:RpiB/LacA/LacB family sugar-phosphate isomerase [Planctomycetota bacterium]